MADSTVNNTGSPITLDGTENTVVETAAGVTGHATTQAIADLGGGGGIVTVIADDTDITVAPFNGSTIVVYTALTATRIVTLPPAAGPDQIVLVKDFTGNASDVFPIGFAASGGDSVPDVAITKPFADLTFVSDDVSVWSSLISERTEVVAARVQAIEDELGGTDGDGNVYSIEFSSDEQRLTVKCETAAHVIYGFSVKPSGILLEGVPTEDPMTDGGLMWVDGDGFLHVSTGAP